MTFSQAGEHDDKKWPFCIHIENNLDQFQKLTEWVKDLSTQINLSKEALFKLDLILEEHILNTIQHGFKTNHNQSLIGIFIRPEEKQIHLEIVDEGVSFNPLSDHEVNLPDNLSNAKVGGLGIHLIKNYADNICYERRDNKNILNLSISLSSQ